MTPLQKAKKLIADASYRAKKNGGICDLDVEWLENIIIHGRCIKTGIKFVIDSPKKGKGYRNPYGPSLDRIDSHNPDYTYENVNVVVWAYNNAMATWDDEDIILEVAQGIKNKRLHNANIY